VFGGRPRFSRQGKGGKGLHQAGINAGRPRGRRGGLGVAGRIDLGVAGLTGLLAAGAVGGGRGHDRRSAVAAARPGSLEELSFFSWLLLPAFGAGKPPPALALTQLGELRGRTN